MTQISSTQPLARHPVHSNAKIDPSAIAATALFLVVYAGMMALVWHAISIIDPETLATLIP
jgi:hypothetical protein